MTNVTDANFSSMPSRTLCVLWAGEFSRMFDAVLWALDDQRQAPKQI
jgi:hypothetical protein